MPIPQGEHSVTSRQLFKIVLLRWLLLPVIIGLEARAHAQSKESVNQFQKDGLAFDYASSWVLSDQSNGAAQQLTLIDKTNDAQIMIIALRGAITNAKQEEQARAGLIEPSISRLPKQYEDAGIKAERASLENRSGWRDGRRSATAICD